MDNEEKDESTKLSETTDMNDTFIREVGSRSINNKDKYEKHSKKKQKKEKYGHPFLMFLLMLLFMAAGAGGTYYYFEIYTKPVKKEETKDDETTVVKLNDDSYLVTTLLNSLNGKGMPDVDVALQLYRDEKVTVTDLEEKYVRYLIINEAVRENMELNYDVSDEQFLSAQKNLFGDDIKLKSDSIDVCPSIKYNSDEKKYSLDESSNCGYADSSMKFVSSIVNAVKKDKVVEITKAIAFIDHENDKVYKKYVKYSSTDGNIEYKAEDELEGVTSSDFSIDDDSENLYQYKYTFTYNDETESYNFTSIEKSK